MIDIQIVNYKSKPYLLACLTSITRFVQAGSETIRIFILDNNSGDVLTDIPPQYPQLNIKVIQHAKNVGFGSGHNILARQGTAPYILFLNPDVTFSKPRVLDTLLALCNQKNVAIVGLAVNNPDQTQQGWDHGELDTYMAKVANFVGEQWYAKRSKITPVAWVSGACMLVQRKVFEELNGFDENYFLYVEEVDFCRRARMIGYTVLYNPLVRVSHIGQVSGKKK